jgi:hypothetical protein
MLRWTCLFLASTFPRFQDIDNTINFTQYDACKLDVFLRRQRGHKLQICLLAMGLGLMARPAAAFLAERKARVAGHDSPQARAPGVTSMKIAVGRIVAGCWKFKAGRPEIY